MATKYLIRSMFLGVFAFSSFALADEVHLNAPPSAEAPLEATSYRCKGNVSYPVHLSFDDGPRIPQTEIVLNTLKKYGIKATFLLSASNFPSLLAGKPPTEREKKLLALVDRMRKEGHAVGNHSFEHIEHGNLYVKEKSDPETDVERIKDKNRKTIEENLQKSFVVFDKLNLPKPVPFRFPYGSGWFGDKDPANQAEDDRVMGEVVAKGYRPFHWDIDSWDWSKIKRKALPESILKQICSHGGGVVLMHDIHKFTADNLNTIIESIQQSGHTFASEEQIIKYSDKDPIGPLISLSHKASGLRTCDRHVSDLDQVWGSCDQYKNNSSDSVKGTR